MSSLLSPATKQFLLTPYFRFKALWPMWYYLFNWEGRILFQKNPPKLSATQLKIYTDLAENGIAVTSLDELFPGENKLAELRAYVEKQKENPRIRTKKEFYQYLWPPKGPLDFENPFVKLSIRDNILAIVNSYMGMWSKFKSYILAVVEPVEQNAPRIQSQRWHRDPEEKRMCKMFIYLNDVDESSGPFVYIPQSIYGKKYGKLFPQKPPHGSYPEDGAVEQVVPPDDIRIMTGRAGSVIFCDTTGLHRGGYATEKERLMFTAFYSAKTYRDRAWYSYDPNVLKGIQMSKETLYALTP